MRRSRGAGQRYGALVALITSVGASVAACGYNNGDWELDQGSGASAPRGGRSSGGAGPKGGSAQQAGSAGAAAAPRIDSMEPTSGPYGTLVTIRGSGLGDASRSGYVLAVGNRGEVELTPDSELGVVSWSDEEIVFRYPFPAEGAVSLEGPRGDALAGEFNPTWHIAQELEQAPAASALASISREPGRVAILFDTRPLTLLELGPDGVEEYPVTASEIENESLRLYLNAASEIEAIAVSTGADPVLVHLKHVDGELVAEPTAIELQADEYGVAGGAEGAAVWMLREAGWQRARPSAGVWQLDKGPIADPEPSAPDRASGAGSDGSLYLAKSVDTGNFLDDMEAPYMQRLAPTASAFGPSTRAGSSVDDYITSLTLRSSGDGLVVRVCGSDVDPFGLSGTDRYCYDSLHAPSGAQISGVPVDARASAHAFTHERAVAAYCRGDTWLIRTDRDTGDPEAPEQPVGEVVAYPCPEAVALELGGDGEFLPVVRYRERTYLLKRNPLAVPASGAGGAGAGGAGGEAGQGQGGASAAGAGGAP